MKTISGYYLAGAVVAALVPLAAQYGLLRWINAPGITLAVKIAMCLISACLVPVSIALFINLGEVIERSRQHDEKE